jgi:hypothetical protein
MRKASKPFDVRVENHGTLWSFTPLTDNAQAWFSEHVCAEPWQWLGPSLCVEHRLAPDLAEGLVLAGLRIAYATVFRYIN